MPGSSKDFLDMFTSGKGMGSVAENAALMTKMNGKERFDTGEVSQGAQELAQNVEQNEKTGTLQNIADRVRKFLSRPLIPDTSVVDPVTGQKINPFDRLFPDNRVEDPVSGQKVNPDFLKLLQNRPDLRERFDRTGSIYSDM